MKVKYFVFYYLSHTLLICQSEILYTVINDLITSCMVTSQLSYRVGWESMREPGENLINERENINKQKLHN